MLRQKYLGQDSLMLGQIAGNFKEKWMGQKGWA